MCSIQSIITIVKIYTKQINSHSCCNVFKLSFFWVYYQYTKNSECIDIQGLLQRKNTTLPCVKTARERHGKLYHVYKMFRFFFPLARPLWHCFTGRQKVKSDLILILLYYLLSCERPAFLSIVFIRIKPCIASMNLRVHKFKKS